MLDTINQIPGVSFQNNDAYGSAGGTLNVRGFDSSRISLTFDGIPLNDSGNYAIYSNQQIDPELIEQVNVNLGTTDVDSPTASAVGGTVNLRTKTPSHDMGVLASGSIGEFDFWRVFGMIETGETAEAVVKRESIEESGCIVTDLIPLYDFLVSPGGTTERIALFCGRVDAAAANGIHGASEEGEDIKVHVVTFDTAMALLKSQKITAASAIIALQWLALNRDEVRARWTT